MHYEFPRDRCAIPTCHADLATFLEETIPEIEQILLIMQRSRSPQALAIHHIRQTSR